jgi:hypothetical protein
MNAKYARASEQFLSGQINWLSDPIKAVLLDTTVYVVNVATHQALSDIPVGARLAVSGTFSGKSASNGVADANDVAIVGVSGNPVRAVVLFKDTGVENTSTLICYLDQGLGLPLTPSGGTVNLVWDNGTNRIFAL